MYNIRIQEKTAPPKPQSPSSRPRLLGFLYSARLSPLCSAFSPLLGCALPDHEPCGAGADEVRNESLGTI